MRVVKNDELHPDEDVLVGGVYMVLRGRRDDPPQVANVLQMKLVTDGELQRNRVEFQKRIDREARGIDEPSKRESSVESDALGEDSADGSESNSGTSSYPRHTLYYVHYEGYDRRLDEWVERDRFAYKAPVATAVAASLSAPDGKCTLTRSQRRLQEEFGHAMPSIDNLDATSAKLEREHERRTRVKNVDTLFLSNYEITTWYYSPYPDRAIDFGTTGLMNGQEAASADRRKHELYVCEYCLDYFPLREMLSVHSVSCRRRHPPGDEIYRHESLSVFEVSGRAAARYCQCLCLLSKLFMDHKTLYYDVENFMFYVLCEVSSKGAQLVGHFSKEMTSMENNLACIMILPPHQRKGYGKLLIQLSYELSRRQNYSGTPEKPLSDLGKVMYRSYWRWLLITVIERRGQDDMSLNDLSIYSGIAKADIISTLQVLPHFKISRDMQLLSNLLRLADAVRDRTKPPTLVLRATHLQWEPIQLRENPPLELTNGASRIPDSALSSPILSPAVYSEGSAGDMED